MSSGPEFPDVLAGVARLRDSLTAAGEITAAERLDRVLTTYFTTSTEALVEILTALDETRETWEPKLPRTEALLGGQLVLTARDLLHFE